MDVTIESMAKRWTDPGARPLFKGSLIDKDGCCCAQGDVLRCCGWTDAQLREITQEKADAEVARVLGISRAHAVLLRRVNDSQDGCPQDALVAPGKIIGSEWVRVLKFWRHIDRMTADDWRKTAATRDAAGDAARDAAGDAAWAAAWSAARDAARAAAGYAAGDAAWAAAGDEVLDASGATWEIMGASSLTVFFFLPMFGFADAAALDALPD